MYMHLYEWNKPSERIALMRKVISLLAVLALGAGFLAFAGISRPPKGSPNQNQFGASRPELEYLKAVNSAAPPKDPQLLFLLMGAYANANQQAEGAEFLSAPSACWLALAYAPMRRNSSCGSFGGAALLTAFRYSSSGREAPN